jgi:hypothetical protein
VSWTTADPEYWLALREAEDLMKAIRDEMIITSFQTGGRPKEVSLSCALIIALTGNALLNWLLSRHQKQREACAATVQEIIQVTENLGEEDYRFMETIVGVLS